mmetsp:Transcript_4404/g.10574  ORF Transcript_4404/g.10574 Transcript_4404/m.10574 type:complete len:292 (-) Transcript_4404:486-1361(-)
MKRFQSLILLILTLADALVDQIFSQTRSICHDPRVRFDSVSRSPRAKAQIFLQGFDIDQTDATTPTTIRSSQDILPKKDALENIGSADFNVPATKDEDNAYVRFAKDYPFLNNFIIASLKTCAADVMAQTIIGHTPLDELDLQRSLLFCAFGGLYSGAFQYMYQVQVFKKLFDVDTFTSQSWSQKLRDIPGVKALAAQTGLDLTILTLVYLPAFYIFKASVFSGSSDPSDWFSTGVDTYATNFGKDETDLIKVWLPADLICFSVPLYLRMPVRQSVSFLWTVYLSFARGGR